MDNLASYVSVTTAGAIGPTTPIVVYAVHQHTGAGGAATSTIKLGSDAGDGFVLIATGAADSSSLHEFPYGVVVDGGLYADMAAEADLITLVYKKI